MPPKLRQRNRLHFFCGRSTIHSGSPPDLVPATATPPASGPRVCGFRPLEFLAAPYVLVRHYRPPGWSGFSPHRTRTGRRARGLSGGRIVILLAVSVPRLPIIAVIGSGDPQHGNPGLAESVGRIVAEMGFHLLTGGGLGVMQDACRGFASVPDRRGVSIGIIPRSQSADEPEAGYPNPWVEIPILTHLAGRLGPDGADSRNAINVLSAHRILALPGQSGTRAEIQLALRYGKPLLALIPEERLKEERRFLEFLTDSRVLHHLVQREEDGAWVLTAVRDFLRMPKGSAAIAWDQPADTATPRQA